MSTNPTNPEQTTPFLPVVGRIYWMLIGPMILFVLAVSIVNVGAGWFTPADIAFLVLLPALIIARWVEYRGGHPLTASGEPATPGHLSRYVIFALLVGVLTWIVANILGNYVM